MFCMDPVCNCETNCVVWLLNHPKNLQEIGRDVMPQLMLSNPKKCLRSGCGESGSHLQNAAIPRDLR